MIVSLTPELEQFVTAKVEAGRYNSASEVVREGPRLLGEHDLAPANKLRSFNQEPGGHLDSLDKGRKVDPTEAHARLQRKSEQRRKSKREGVGSLRRCRP